MATRLVRFGLAALFVWSGVAKLADPVFFLIALEAFDLGLPPEVLGYLCRLIPWIEFLAAVGLLLRGWARAAALVVTILLVAFSAAIATLRARGLDVACPCFGAVELICRGPLGACHHLRNAVLTAAAILVVVRVDPTEKN